eukprot:188407_1
MASRPTRTNRRRKKRQRANTLDPTQDLHRYANSSRDASPDEETHKKKHKKKTRKSKSPRPDYKPVLKDKVKKKTTGKSKRPRSARSGKQNAFASLDTSSLEDNRSSPFKPKKRKKKKKYSETPRGGYVGKSSKIGDDPFDIHSDNSPEPVEVVPLSTLINNAMDTLGVCASSTKYEITTIFNEFRQIINERQTKLLGDVDSTLTKKRSILQTQLEYIEENNENSTDNTDIACDPVISLTIDKKQICETLRYCGWIEGASYATAEDQERHEREQARRRLAKQQYECVERLKEMTLHERDCNKKREDGVRLNEEIQKEILFINRETKQCEDKLNEAKPQLEAAKLLVSNISKAELNEIRSLKKPPAVVELVMTAVAIILKEEKPKNWREIQKNLLNDTKFVRNVLQFDTMRFGKKARKQCTQVMEHKDFNEERANKASKVAGPLVKWSQSQCFYAKMLEVVRPMMKKVDKLKKDLGRKQTQLVMNVDKVRKLESKIGTARTEINEMVNHMIEQQDTYHFGEEYKEELDDDMD